MFADMLKRIEHKDIKASKQAKIIASKEKFGFSKKRLARTAICKTKGLVLSHALPGKLWQNQALRCKSRRLSGKVAKKKRAKFFIGKLAESEGFEPPIGINLYTLSRRAP